MHKTIPGNNFNIFSDFLQLFLFESGLLIMQHVCKEGVKLV